MKPTQFIIFTFSSIMVKAEDIWEMEADRSIHRDNEVNLIINQIREFIEIILIFRTFLEY